MMARTAGLNILGKSIDYFFKTYEPNIFTFPSDAVGFVHASCKSIADSEIRRQNTVQILNFAYCLTDNCHGTRKQEKGNEKLL